MFEVDRVTAKVFASFLVNASAGWFLTIFVTKDLWVLLIDILAFIISLRTAILIERNLENV